MIYRKSPDYIFHIVYRLLISLREKYLFLEKKYIIEKKVSFLEKNILN